MKNTEQRAKDMGITLLPDGVSFPMRNPRRYSVAGVNPVNKGLLFGGGALIVGGIGLAAWYFYNKYGTAAATATSTASAATDTATSISTVKYTLTTSTNPSGMGVIQGNLTSYNSGAIATITAVPTDATKYRFNRWGGDATGTTASTSIVMNGNKSVVAYFIETSASATYTLTTSVSPTSGYIGSITGNLGKYNAGDTATITAVETSHCRFLGWGGDVDAITYSIDIIMDSDKKVIAYFAVIDQPAPEGTLEIVGVSPMAPTGSLPGAVVNAPGYIYVGQEARVYVTWKNTSSFPIQPIFNFKIWATNLVGFAHPIAEGAPNSDHVVQPDHLCPMVLSAIVPAGWEGRDTWVEINVGSMPKRIWFSKDNSDTPIFFHVVNPELPLPNTASVDLNTHNVYERGEVHYEYGGFPAGARVAIGLIAADGSSYLLTSDYANSGGGGGGDIHVLVEQGRSNIVIPTGDYIFRVYTTEQQAETNLSIIPGW